MSEVLLFLTTGFEETEALSTVDILRRGNVELTIASLTDELHVTGAHGIVIKADKMFDEAVQNEYDMLILPGGPGTKNYDLHTGLIDLIHEYNNLGKYISAICAAPVFLGRLGLLRGKEAFCYPAMKNELLNTGANSPGTGIANVVTSGNITTSIGPGTTFSFALSLLKILEGEETSLRVKKDFIL